MGMSIAGYEARPTEKQAAEGQVTVSLAETRLAAPFLSPKESRLLETATLYTRAYGPDVHLVHEGGASDQLFVVTDGWACRYKVTRDGSRQIVAVIIPGDIANLDALISDRSDFGVCSLTPVQVVAVPCQRILALAAQHSGIGKLITRLALCENAALTQWAFCLGRKPAGQRLAHFLCEMAMRVVGDSQTKEASFDFPLTQGHLADVLGLTPVHVNRTMQQLRADGLVVTHRRRIALPDMRRLQAFAEFDKTYLHLEEADARSVEASRAWLSPTMAEYTGH